MGVEIVNQKDKSDRDGISAFHFLSFFTSWFQLIFIATFIEYEASTYGDYTFPAWADALGWIMAVAIILAIPITMLYQVSVEDEDTSIWGVSNVLCLLNHLHLLVYINVFTNPSRNMSSVTLD